jgi:hypothetical protein
MQTAEEKRAYFRAHYHANKEMWREKRKRYENRIRASILAAKDKPCMDCGGRWPALVMEFDHREGEVKLFNIGNWYNQRRVGAKKLWAEIAKCDVVCPTCHRLRTFRRRGLL